MILFLVRKICMDKGNIMIGDSILYLFAVLLALCSCQVGDFEPHRNQLHELNKTDCGKTPERCINGYPW